MRNNERPVTPDGVELLLEATDVLNTMLTQVQNDEPVDEARVTEVKNQLEVMLGAKAFTGRKLWRNNQKLMLATKIWSIKFVPTSPFVDHRK